MDTAWRRLWHLLFRIVVIVKAIDGVFELAGGILLLVMPVQQLHPVGRFLTRHDLASDRHDAVASFIAHLLHHDGNRSILFAAIYLVWHGAVKSCLMIALLFRQRWAFPVAMIAILLFIGYQMYRFAETHAAILLVLSALDAAVVVLTVVEYRHLRASGGFARQQPGAR
ncbi:MAG: DUF2127 domain-containing protein [Gemmatimonadales bacterium]